MFIRTLAAVAIVPFKTCDLAKVGHAVYDRYIQKRVLMQYVLAALRALMLAMALAVLPLPALAAPDAGFTQFIASLWPEAQAQGVSRATFDVETRGLEPDFK